MPDINIVKGTKSVVEVKDTDNQNLSEKEREDIFTQLLLGQDATGEVETSRGTFTVKFPKEKDRLAIGRLMCVNRGGLPVNSFDIETENRNLICSTLNILVVKIPNWFEDAKKKVKNFSFEEVPDEEFLLELYQKACSFRDKVQESFREKGKANVNGISTAENMVNDVADNVPNKNRSEATS
ncbi:MAG: hypothetical protein ACTTJ3_05680 [Treponema sp.]